MSPTLKSTGGWVTLCPNLGVFSLEQTRLLGAAKSERLRLTNGEIIFEEFQPMWSQFTNVISASRGKNGYIGYGIKLKQLETRFRRTTLRGVQTTPQQRFMSTDAHFGAKIGFKFQSLGKISKFQTFRHLTPLTVDTITQFTRWISIPIYFYTTIPQRHGQADRRADNLS